MSRLESISNPKAQHASGRGRAHWYPYYAGYSPAFVSDMLKELSLGHDAVVLDPWNGSGTTTTVCSISGVRSTGYDLNPSMIVVAKARLLDANTSGSLLPLLTTILKCAKDRARYTVNDPLTAWFTNGCAGRLRAVELAIQEVLTERLGSAALSPVDVRGLSSLAAFYYVLLFRFVRCTLKQVATTNPTWIKAGIDSSSRINLSWREISDGLVADLRQIRLLDGKGEVPHRYASATLDVADSRMLPLDDSSIDAVITSPPYCTRIDYAVATRAELAVLNTVHDAQFDELRRHMIGSTISSRAEIPLASEDPLVRRLLEKIGQHPSKASSGYYLNTFRDYFTKLDASLTQIARVLKSGGWVSMVVQDSAYKDVHVDLATIVESMLGAHGLSMKARWDFPVTKSLRQIQSIARRQNRTCMPTESIVLLSKP